MCCCLGRMSEPPKWCKHHRGAAVGQRRHTTFWEICSYYWKDSLNNFSYAHTQCSWSSGCLVKSMSVHFSQEVPWWMVSGFSAQATCSSLWPLENSGHFFPQSVFSANSSQLRCTKACRPPFVSNTVVDVLALANRDLQTWFQAFSNLLSISDKLSSLRCKWIRDLYLGLEQLCNTDDTRSQNAGTRMSLLLCRWGGRHLLVMSESLPTNSLPTVCYFWEPVMHSSEECMKLLYRNQSACLFSYLLSTIYGNSAPTFFRDSSLLCYLWSFNSIDLSSS